MNVLDKRESDMPTRYKDTCLIPPKIKIIPISVEYCDVIGNI